MLKPLIRSLVSLLMIFALLSAAPLSAFARGGGKPPQDKDKKEKEK